ncbi:class E sortase [Proteinivorax hydrogeniformans]|uniref:Class E sortase n=1 Tax=Proteinivorax hydrogeniformans TaxID=1826727 RepID=A0AAU8HRV2_9FIRM
MILYPSFLKFQSYRVQRQLRSEFENFIENEPKPINQQLDLAGHQRDMGEITPFEEVIPPKLTEFPPTEIRIPSITVSTMVVVGESIEAFSDINHQPGYYPDSAFPGMGNVLIGGHRGGPAGYFRKLNELKAGDEIMLRTPRHTYHYSVNTVKVVERDDWSIAQENGENMLTLTTCQGEGSDTSAKRLVVQSSLEKVTLHRLAER